MKTLQRSANDSIPSDEGAQDLYELQLYVSGATSHSRLAIENIKAIVTEHLGERCRLTVTDIYQELDAVRDQDVVVIPMLVKRSPLPLKRIVGDLSNHEHVLRGLGIVCGSEVGNECD